ncbi:MAG: hypothetical protein HC817_14180 [Saprospiraceae bacterium]|nr:hypothetical protein [Saprospiraceae bacterium]
MFFVGLTHLMIENDKEIAAKNPSVSLIMGGHEHNNMLYKIGNTVVAKADANAVTAYVHRCSYDIKTRKTTIFSQLVKIDETIAEEPAVAEVVKKWTNIADEAYKKAGFNPSEVVTTLKKPLDGRSAIVRLGQSEMGSIIAQAMTQTAKKPIDCAFFNSGSIRIDDEVNGTVTQQDIVRILPFGGKLVEFDILGSELKKVLTAGLLNRGKGGYLQWHKIQYDDKAKLFIINGSPLDEQKKYHAITTDFLLSGKESNLEFFIETNPSVSNIEKPTEKSDLRSDIRQAFIAF